MYGASSYGKSEYGGLNANLFIRSILSESVVVTPVANKITKRIYAEVISIADSIVKVPIKVISNSVRVVASIKKYGVKVIANSIVVTPVKASIATLHKVISESVVVTVAGINAVLVILRVIEENLIVITASLTKKATKVIANSIVVTAARTQIATIHRTIADAISVAAETVTNRTKVIVKTETIRVATSIIRKTKKVISNVIRVTASHVKRWTIFRGLSDSIVVSDTLSLIRYLSKVISDSIVVSESILKHVAERLKNAIGSIKQFVGIRSESRKPRIGIRRN